MHAWALDAQCLVNNKLGISTWKRVKQVKLYSPVGGGFWGPTPNAAVWRGHHTKPVKLWGLCRPIFLPTPNNHHLICASANPLMQICLQYCNLKPGGCSEWSINKRCHCSIQRSWWNIELMDQSHGYHLEGLAGAVVSFYQSFLKDQLRQTHQGHFCSES